MHPQQGCALVALDCRWRTPEYLLNVLGHRTVPVEVGSHYLADGWGQQLMTFREFYHRCFGCEASEQRPLEGPAHAAASDPELQRGSQEPSGPSVAPVQGPGEGPAQAHRAKTSGSAVGAAAAADHSACRPCTRRAPIAMHRPAKRARPAQERSAEAGEHVGGSDEHRTGAGAAPQEGASAPARSCAGGPMLYLAQHTLFDQVPELRKDIMVRVPPLMHVRTHPRARVCGSVCSGMPGL
jgi:hypothetical protein